MSDLGTNALPRGWESTSLGECSEILAGVGFPKHLQGTTDQEIPVFKVGDISRAWQDGRLYLQKSPNTVTSETARKLSPRLIPPNTVVFAKIGAAIALNRRAVLARPSLVDNNVMGLHPDTCYLDPKFLFHFICTVRLQEYSRATTVPSVRKGDVAGIHFSLPPICEQRRIVDVIEAHFTRLNAAVETLKRVQTNLKRYRASVLKAAVEGRLVPTEAELARREGRDYEPASKLLERILVERRRRWEQAELVKMRAKGKEPKGDKWKAKYKEPMGPEPSSLPRLPEGWCWATLPQLGELNRGKSKHRPRNDPRLLNGPYPFIQTGDVRRSDGFIDAYNSTYSEFGLAQSRLWPPGTLCITIAANIAETGILKFDACFPDSVVGFLNSDQPILVRFIELFIRTARERLDRFAPATAQKNINLATLSALAVPLPPPAEQNRIIEAVDRVLSVGRVNETTASVSRTRCQRLRQSILKWAFEGKLVDQDPDDEPASVLLERIKAERAKS